MNVLIGHSYFYRLDAKQFKFKQPYPPLGTLLAAAVVRQLGHQITFFDANLQRGPEALASHLERMPEVIVFYDDGFNYLTKMCLTTMRQACFEMISASKKTGAKIIVCSSDASDRYEEYLNRGADIIIRGEGEQTLNCLLNVLLENHSVENVEGIALLRAGRVVVTPRRPVLRNLDELPLPAWDLVDMEAYRKIWQRRHGYFSLNIATTRGCPYKCNWCAKPIYGNRYTIRSPECVVQEIEFLLSTYGPDHFWVCDDIFGLKPGWLHRFSALVKEKNLRFRYKIQSRVDLLLDGAVVDELASSGAETVWVGAESGSQKILDAMDKGTTIDQIRKATALLKQKKINVGFFLQFGYPGESLQDISATINLVLDLMPDEIGISVSYPLPGTPFYDRVKNDLQVKQNWKDSDDLALLYKSTFPPAYYRILHRYIHSLYRIKRGVSTLKRQRAMNLRYIFSMIYHTPLSIFQAYRLRLLSHEQ